MKRLGSILLLGAILMGALQALPAAAAPPLTAQLLPAYAYERAGDHARAVDAYLRWADPSTALGREALLGAARSRIRSGDQAGAVEAARRVLAVRPSHPEAWIVLARALERAGDLKGAAEGYSRALAAGGQPAAYLKLRLARVTHSPEIYRMVRADAAAAPRWRAEAALALGDPTAPDYAAPRHRPDVLIRAGRFAELAQRYPCRDEAVLGLPSAGLLERATILYCSYDFRGAEALLAGQAGDAPSRIYLAKMRIALQDDSGALAAVEPLVGTGLSAWTAEVWLEAARAYARLERWMEAAQAFARFSAAYPVSMGWEDAVARTTGAQLPRPSSLPDHPLAVYLPNVRRQVEEMAFQAGLERFRAGDPAGAATHWNRWLEAGLSPAFQARILLWLGKADGAAAGAYWSRAAAADPEGYYGLRARRLLEGGPPGGGMAGPATAGALASQSAEAWLASFAPTRASAESEVALAQHGQLQTLGLWEEAEEVVRDAISTQRSDPRSLVVLALGLHDQDAHRLAIAAAGQALAGAPPGRMADLPQALQRVLFPAAFAEEVWSAAAAYGLDPAYLSGLVRSESHFDPYARSRANAMGLTQIIPGTAATLAPRAGYPGFAQADLFQPEISLRMGARYLWEQLGRFGQPSYAAAAYNAGPGNAARWLAESGGDLDLFVETISFGETHRYVRHLEEARYHFARLY